MEEDYDDDDDDDDTGFMQCTFSAID